VANSDVQKVFGAVVRDWRSHLGFSQEELAERAELHRTYISDVERGARNISLGSIIKLAHALDISVSALFPESVPIEKNDDAKINVHDRNLVDVLLVEDNADDVEMTLQAFKKARFSNHVHVVNNGAKALDYVFCRGEYARRPAKAHPQLILLDLNLPKVSGLDVLRRIKADKRTWHIPVAVLTASQESYDRAECQRLGAEHYITKPVNFQRLSQITPQLNLDWALLKSPDSKRRNVGA